VDPTPKSIASPFHVSEPESFWNFNLRRKKISPFAYCLPSESIANLLRATEVTPNPGFKALEWCRLRPPCRSPSCRQDR
jgi:hypothetical protein